MQRVEVVHHEEGVDVVAGLLGPHGQLLGVEASIALGAGLVKEKREGGGGKQAVHHVDAHLLVGVLVLQALQAHEGALVAAGDAAGDAEEHRGHARLVGLAEGLVVLELGGLGGHGAGAAADGVVELVGAAGLEEVVVAGKAAVGAIRLDVVERQDANVLLGCLGGREVAGGVTHDVALCCHGISLRNLSAAGARGIVGTIVSA